MINRYFQSKESFLAFRHIDFRRFIFSKFLLTLALQIQFVVLSWQVFQLTHDYLSLGLLGLAEAIPAVGLALYGGFIADRNDRRKIIIIVMAGQFLTSIALMFISIYYEKNAGLISSAFPFYVIMFCVGLLRGFYSPAQMPLMTQVVPREAYANSSAWNSTFWHIAVVLGSTGGGLMLGFFGKKAFLRLGGRRGLWARPLKSVVERTTLLMLEVLGFKSHKKGGTRREA